jgi:hypothetical protein
MQQPLDRRQPSARLRPQLREIPLQRRYGTAGNGETNRQWTCRDGRSSLLPSCVTAPRDLPSRAADERRTGDPLRGGGVLVDVGNAPDAAAGQDVQAAIAAATGPEVLDEHGPDLVDHGRTGGEVPEDVGVSAAPAAEPVGGVGQPEEAPDLPREGGEGQPVVRGEFEVLGGDVRQVVGQGVNQVRSLVGLAALSAGTEKGGADRVDQPTVDAGGDQRHDAQPAGGQMAEEGRPAAVVFATGDLLSEHLPVAVAVDTGDQQARAMTTRPPWLTFSPSASADGNV